MLRVLSRNWWLLALRGAFAILFGILAFVWPLITIGVLVIMFGIYALLDGISTIITGFSDRKNNNRWWILLLEGFIGIVAGIMTFVWPNLTAVLLLYFVAAWAIFTGLIEILAAIRLREELENEWVLGLSGLLSILLGFVLAFNPGSGALALVWVIGSYAVLFGGLLLYLGFKVRGLESDHARFDSRPGLESG